VVEGGTGPLSFVLKQAPHSAKEWRTGDVVPCVLILDNE
jgi:hypothetical protein